MLWKKQVLPNEQAEKYRQDMSRPKKLNCLLAHKGGKEDMSKKNEKENNMNIDNVIYKIVESLDFDEKICLGNHLGDVDTDFTCVLDDMYPDRISELDESLGARLLCLFDGP